MSPVALFTQPSESHFSCFQLSLNQTKHTTNPDKDRYNSKCLVPELKEALLHQRSDDEQDDVTRSRCLELITEAADGLTERGSFFIVVYIHPAEVPKLSLIILLKKIGGFIIIIFFINIIHIIFSVENSKPLEVEGTLKTCFLISKVQNAEQQLSGPTAVVVSLIRFHSTV